MQNDFWERVAKMCREAEETERRRQGGEKFPERILELNAYALSITRTVRLALAGFSTILENSQEKQALQELLDLASELPLRQ